MPFVKAYKPVVQRSMKLRIYCWNSKSEPPCPDPQQQNPERGQAHNDLSHFLGRGAHICVHMCMGVCTVRPEIDISSLRHTSPSVVRQALSLYCSRPIHLDKLAGKPQGSLVSSSPAWGLWVCITMSSFLHGPGYLNSSPHSKTFANQTVSPAQFLDFSD